MKQAEVNRPATLPDVADETTTRRRVAWAGLIEVMDLGHSGFRLWQDSPGRMCIKKTTPTACRAILLISISINSLRSARLFQLFPSPPSSCPLLFSLLPVRFFVLTLLYSLPHTILTTPSPNHTKCLPSSPSLPLASWPLLSLLLATVLSSRLLATPVDLAVSAILPASTSYASCSHILSLVALGVDTSTPRDGTRRRPFQQDSTRFRGDQADTFGETIGAGNNDLEAGTKAIMAETGEQLPQVTPGGEVNMTLHQVNGDGAGPYTCSMSADASGSEWTDITVTQSPPGKNSRNRDGAETDFPLTAALPEDASCTGTVAGQDNVCLIRCENGARAGPFGGVVPVQSKSMLFIMF